MIANRFYIPRHRACLVLDKYAPGWQFRITNVQQIGDELVMTGSLSIPTSDGVITRESTGSEKVNTTGYGETAANAESQCFRRCCARFGALFVSALIYSGLIHTSWGMT